MGKSPFQQQPKLRYQSSKPTAWPGTQSNLTIWFISHFKSLTQSVIPTQSRCNPEIYQQLVNGRPAIYRTRSGQTGRPSTYCDRISGSHSPITGHFRRHRQRMHQPTMFAQSQKIITQSRIPQQSQCNQEIQQQSMDGRPAIYRTRPVGRAVRQPIATRLQDRAGIAILQ